MTPESNAPSVDPRTVGNAFVLKYYDHLYKSPAQVHRFYLDNSILSRPAPNGDMVYAKSFKEISDQIMSLDYSKIQILAADSQPSLNNGVVTLVTGLVVTKDGERRRFSQSFFLVPQNGSYFVLNDSLRYMSEPQKVPDTTQLMESTDVTTNPVKVVTSPSQAKATVTNPVTPIANGHAEVPKEIRNSNLPKAAQAKPQEDAPKKSFAVIVAQSLTQNNGPSNVKVSPAKPKHVEKPKVAPEAKAPAPKPSVPVSGGPSAGSIAKPGPGSAIFVAKLPMDTTPEHLYETFKDFGAIRKNGIQVKSYTEQRNCFGFVAFESGEAAKSVLQAQKKSAIIIGNRRVSVEEKRANNNNNGGRSYEQNNYYNKNENGYRNEGYRPRGNGFNGGRGNGRNGDERQNGEAAGGAKASQKNGHDNAHAKN